MSCGCTAEAMIQSDAHVSESALMARGGFAVAPLLYGVRGVQSLLNEAIACYPHSKESNTSVDDTEEWRGGNPARRFLSCGAGPVLDHYYHAPEILQFLRDITQLEVVSTGARGTYTYYVRPGDYLSIHRDVRTCDLAVVTCLMDTATPEEGGGMMDLYPQRTNAPLSDIRSSPQDGRISIRLQPGETIVMLGGLVPHAITPVGEAQQRIVSVLCYEVR